MVLIPLLLLGLLLWQLHRSDAAVNPVAVDPEELLEIKLVYSHPMYPNRDTSAVLTDEAEIRSFCQLWNNNWVTEIKTYASHGYIGLVDMLVGSANDLHVYFVNMDGTELHYSLMEEFIFDENVAEKAYFHTSLDILTFIKAQLGVAAQ